MHERNNRWKQWKERKLNNRFKLNKISSHTSPNLLSSFISYIKMKNLKMYKFLNTFRYILFSFIFFTIKQVRDFGFLLMIFSFPNTFHNSSKTLMFIYRFGKMKVCCR